MNNEVSDCKSEGIIEAKLKNLSTAHGINVWISSQDSLNEQASQAAEIFSRVGNQERSEKLAAGSPLDINSYLKRQEELKKIQEYRKSLRIPNESKVIADRINAAAITVESRRKRKCLYVGDGKKRTRLPAEQRTVDTPAEVPRSDSDSEYVPSDQEFSDSDYYTERKDNVCVEKSSRKKKSNSVSVEKVKDDGCLKLFKERLEEYYRGIEKEAVTRPHATDNDTNISNDLEYYTIKKGLRIPFKVWNRLYEYQRDGVRWLWKLHKEVQGGILGDEMGLGKTVQVIAFLVGLEYSQVISLHSRFRGLGPTLIVCPATVIHQWVKHFHEWAPEFRVAVLHQSGSYQGTKSQLIKEINQNKGVIVTTYLGVLKFEPHLLNYNWHYLILDEGHKIRNSCTKVSGAVRRIRTPHRIMLTGSPMQNNLQELWSLFDFTNHGMLGTLDVFMEHFAQPIVQGGFTNATPIQEATALTVASTLKDMITPFLLRRTKHLVQNDINLPSKTEQVLFCSLSDEQRELYKGYLMSGHVAVILGRDSRRYFSDNQMRANILVAITALKKICNHPDIYLQGINDNQEDHDEDEMAPVESRVGYYKKSGKMIVVSALLKIWKKQKHRVLLFTQSRAMIAIFEDFLNQQGYTYLKMDGSTSVNSRHPLINKFNQDSSLDVFLLTTRVGGLGINLTGADRVIIYDPDWNPATDTQAKERAWRIGQDKQVTIYRLLSAGTIEEKMYQRQVWKQLLGNKVLMDPKTKKYFKSSNLYDLFSLPDYKEQANPETTNIFYDSKITISEDSDKVKTSRRDIEDLNKTKIDDHRVTFPQEKLKEMKRLAQQISQTIAKSEDQSGSVKKNPTQIELEEERKRRLCEKEDLKKLSPLELLQLNRERGRAQPEDCVNKVDDCSTDVSFSQALRYAEETAQLYSDLRRQQQEAVSLTENAASTSRNNAEDGGGSIKLKKRSKNKGSKKKMDSSGKIDGEKVEGLVKMEIKTAKRKAESSLAKSSVNEEEDNYVLQKLFSKKGVSGALEHSSVVKEGVQCHGLKVSIEARVKADIALEAIRRSRPVTLNGYKKPTSHK